VKKTISGTGGSSVKAEGMYCTCTPYWALSVPMYLYSPPAVRCVRGGYGISVLSGALSADAWIGLDCRQLADPPDSQSAPQVSRSAKQDQPRHAVARKSSCTSSPTGQPTPMPNGGMIEERTINGKVTTKCRDAPMGRRNFRLFHW
jgi:hypothetical protein